MRINASQLPNLITLVRLGVTLACRVVVTDHRQTSHVPAALR